MIKKLKDTPIVEKLPKKKKEVWKQGDSQKHYINVGRNKAVDEVLNTELDLSEIAEVDVEEAEYILGDNRLLQNDAGQVVISFDDYEKHLDNLAQALSGCIKWREK